MDNLSLITNTKYSHIMTLQEIKNNLEIPTFHLNTPNDAEGNPTQWLRHWDNERRIAVSIHKDLFDELKKDSTVSNLGLQTETRIGSKGEYQALRIVKFKPSEFTL